MSFAYAVAHSCFLAHSSSCVAPRVASSLLRRSVALLIVLFCWKRARPSLCRAGTRWCCKLLLLVSFLSYFFRLFFSFFVSMFCYFLCLSRAQVLASRLYEYEYINLEKKKKLDSKLFPACAEKRRVRVGKTSARRSKKTVSVSPLPYSRRRAAPCCLAPSLGGDLETARQRALCALTAVSFEKTKKKKRPS